MSGQERRLDPGRILVDGDGRMVDEAALDAYALDKHPYYVAPAKGRER